MLLLYVKEAADREGSRDRTGLGSEAKLREGRNQPEENTIMSEAEQVVVLTEKKKKSLGLSL